MQAGIVSNWSEEAQSVPWVLIVLTLVCVLAQGLYTLMTPLAQQAMIDLAGAIPERTADLLDLPAGQWLDGGAATLVSSLLVHATWLHLAGNLVYLWVFGMKVEQHLGKLFLAGVFLIGGALAHIIVALRMPGLQTPIIGASGAVSAVLGAYLGLFPTSRIGLYLPLGLFLQFARVPALLVIGSWFTLQLLYSVFGPITGSVAWWTHLAGFTLGLMFALLARALGQFNFGLFTRR